MMVKWVGKKLTVSEKYILLEVYLKKKKKKKSPFICPGQVGSKLLKLIRKISFVIHVNYK